MGRVGDEIGAHLVGDLAEERVVDVPGYEIDPHTIALGRRVRARVRTCSWSISPDSASTPYPTKSNQRPEKLAGDPCVRCPPKCRPIASTVSPGRSRAAYAASTAEDPEWDCTLACSAPNSALARSTASRSATSTISQPPWYRAPG